MLPDTTYEITTTYTTEDFLRAAARVENLSADDCDPALFRNRERYASDLRRMAPKPHAPSHVNAMNKLFIFDHSLRRRAV